MMLNTECAEVGTERTEKGGTQRWEGKQRKTEEDVVME